MKTIFPKRCTSQSRLSKFSNLSHFEFFFLNFFEEHPSGHTDKWKTVGTLFTVIHMTTEWRSLSPSELIRAWMTFGVPFSHVKSSQNIYCPMLVALDGRDAHGTAYKRGTLWVTLDTWNLAKKPSLILVEEK